MSGQSDSNKEFMEQLRMQELYSQRNEDGSDPYTYTDPEDGTVYDWDHEKKAWFPKITEDFIAAYQANYGFTKEGDPDANNAALSSKDPAVPELERKLPEKEKPADPAPNPVSEQRETAAKEAKQKGEKRKAEPGWFDIDDNKNTNVYVSGLPPDISTEEFVELMSKCGIVMRDPITEEYKVKLYKDKEGNLKGDGLCCYLKKESVALAMRLIDESEVRGYKLHVEAARFELQHSNNLSTGHGSVSDSAAGGLSRAGHTAAAVVLGFVLVLGFLGNFLVLLVFSRFPGLRTPISLLLINISVSDMLVCIFGTPLSFAASVRGRWLTGSYGCRWYGFSNALFGIVSLVSLSLLSFERYSSVCCSIHSDSSQYRRVRLAVAASWFYSLAWTLPPLLGWSSYGLEGPGTTCSVQWHQHTTASRSYISCLFIFCLLLPLLLMFFCYWRILVAVRAVARQVARIHRSSAEWREGRVLLMVVAMVTGYLLCWMPYGVVAMLASFGRPGVVPPAASLIPSLLAKTSTVLNPVIYVLLNTQFSRCFLYMMRCSSEAPPSPVLPTQPSSRAAWPHDPNLPTEEQNTTPAMLISRDQQVQQPILVLVAQCET